MIQTARNLAADAVDAAGGKVASAAGNAVAGAAVAAGTKLAGPVGAAAAGALAPTIRDSVGGTAALVVGLATAPVASVLRGVVEEVPSLNASAGTAVGQSANKHSAISIEEIPFCLNAGGLFNPIPNSAISDADRLRKLCELTDPAKGGTRWNPHTTERTLTLRDGEELKIINDYGDQPNGNVTLEYRRSGETEYSSFVTIYNRPNRPDGCSMNGGFEGQLFNNFTQGQPAHEFDIVMARHVDSARVILDSIIGELEKAS